MIYATNTLIQCVIVLLLVGVWPVLAQPHSGLPPEAEQVLFLVDDSASMTATAGDPDEPLASRWQVLQKAYPKWLDRLGPEVLVGAVSVGGVCQTPPAIYLPVGAARQQIATAIGAARPHGWTNLNAVLQTTPSLFAPAVKGGKRIVLLSDGRNTCPPQGSTCNIARQLHRDHGIVIDVVAWVTEAGMLDEFQCVTRATGGTFTAPRTLKELINIPLPTLDLWRYIVLTLGFVTLLLAARILYRHGHHVWGWGTGHATLASGLFLTLGTLSVYLVLFVSAGVMAALVGLVVLTGLGAVVAYRRPAHPTAPSAGLSPWMLGLLLAGSLCLPRGSFATERLPGSCAKVVHGPARYHHILALDMSGSVIKHFEAMKGLLACYAEMYVLPQEEISLIVFGLDEAGTVKELRTFTVPPSGATAILKALLNDLKIQEPQRTKTYFKPLADFLNQFLPGVRLQPVTLVVSDGQSDGRAQAKRGLTPPPDIPFESLGKRGIYSAPGVQGWRVAITGGGGLDLTALFQQPIVSPTKKNQAVAPQDAVIDPCLIDPDLVLETDERIVLWPHWNPFSGGTQGVLSVWVGHTCVARFGSFTVELRHGNETLPVGRVTQTLIDQHPRRFSFPVAARGAAPAEAVVQVSLDRGSTTQTIYPHKPAVVTLETVSYFSAFWRHLAVALLLLVTVCIALPPAVRRVAAFIQQYRGKQRHRPEVITVLGGPVISLLRNQPVSIGEGCSIAAPGMPRGVVLAVATWTGIRGVLTLRPGDGVRMRVNGVEVDGEATYHLGQPLQFLNAADGTPYEVTLSPGSSRDIGFGMPLAVNGIGSDRTEGFSGRGAPLGNETFGAIPSTSSGDRANAGAYI